MWKVFSYFLLLQSVAWLAMATENDTVHSSIVGGEEATPHEFPWVVNLKQLQRGKHALYCGGSIISERIVLTAAHCLKGYKEQKVVVVAGDHELSGNDGAKQIMDVEKFVIHEDYKGIKSIEDIGLVFLKEKLSFDRNVRAIELPTGSMNNPSGFGMVVGWGSHQPNGKGFSNILRKVRVPVQTDEKCELEDKFVSSKLFCAGEKGKDFCSGDSGGSFVAENYPNVITGIVSYSFGDCGDRPGYYVKVSAYRKWIDDNIKNLRSTSNANDNKSSVIAIVSYNIVSLIFTYFHNK